MSTTAIVLWFAIPLGLTLMSDSPKPLWLTPIGLLVAAYFGIRWLTAQPAVIRAARDARVEREYQATLRLIDWKPRPASRTAEVEDALEIERPDA